MIVVVLIFLGLVFGSFANAVAWRLHEQQRSKKRAQDPALSIVTGRSMCTHCGHLLNTRDLIPVVSYVWLRGRCRYCHKPITDTPLPELLLPVVLVVSYIWWPFAAGSTVAVITFDLWVLLLVAFMILALYDLRWQLLPDRVVFPVIGLALAMVGVRAMLGDTPTVLLTALWGVLCTAGLFYLLYLVSRGRWIGFGDVKLAIALGLLVGGPFPALLVLFVASLLGSLAAIPLLLRGGAVGSTRIPFGPFLLLATVVVMLWGTNVIAWYTSLLAV